MSNESGNTPRHSPILIGTGVFALLWIVARAAVQSITIDEADTYLGSVWRPGPSTWDGSSNNHVLNSLLMRLFTSIFGASPVTLRLPALIGAALFLAASYVLVRAITRRPLLQWSIFVCLTCSPFVMDYLVAARGYSLASAFLLGMIALAAHHFSFDPEERTAALRRTCMLISFCGALSVSANFSFAVADAVVGLGLYLWFCREYRREYGKLLFFFTAPGLVTAYCIVGSVVQSWPKGQFTWGADSDLKTLKSLVSASLFEPNNYLLQPKLLHYFNHFAPYLYPALAILIVWRIVALALERRANWLALVGGGAIVLSLAIHEVLFQVYGILLPLDRTAMWLALLFLLTAGALAGVESDSLMGRASRQALTFILAVIAIYNLGCLRLTYFNEWKYDADMKNVYAVLAAYNHRYGLTKVSTNWRYVASLNCYRTMSRTETLEPIPGAPQVVNFYPDGYQAYVFYYPWDEDWVKRNGLKIVYHDKLTDAAIGIRPEVESGAGRGE